MSAPVDRYLKLHAEFDMLLLDYLSNMKRDELVMLLLSTLTLDQKRAAVGVMTAKKKRRASSSGASARAGTQHEEEG